MPDYIVIDENTLGYRDQNWENFAIVLASSLIRGGRDWKDGAMSTFGSTVRPATPADFDQYRVQLPPDFETA